MTSYEDKFPREQGPPPVASYGGPDALEAREPIYILELDAGAFRAVWELLEAEAKHRYPTHTTMSAARAYLRAVDSFRSCYQAMNKRREPLRLKFNQSGKSTSTMPSPTSKSQRTSRS